MSDNLFLRTTNCIFCEKPTSKKDVLPGHVLAVGFNHEIMITASFHEKCENKVIPLGGCWGEWTYEMGVRDQKVFET